MIISMNHQKLPKAIKTLSDTDLKRMAESNFKPSGWQDYAHSPYAEYEKKIKTIRKGNKK